MALNYKQIGKASDLQDKKERYFYRFFEILPGFLSLGTLVFLILFSFIKPAWVGFFIIIYDLYILWRVIYMSVYLIVCYVRMKKRLRVNWFKKCVKIFNSLDGFPYYHLIILPTYKEGIEVLKTSFQSLVNSKYPLDKIIVVLAMEKRAGKERLKRAKFIKENFGHKFGHFLITHHPDDIAGEIAGKGSNEKWAGQQAKKYIDKLGLDYKKIICSVFDCDTCVHPQYLSCLAYVFHQQPNPHKASYQPIPLFHNNIWDAPGLMRMIASSNTFWQMMQQERKEQLITFSSHSMSFKTVIEVGWWQNNIVSEDSRIFFQCLYHYNGDYEVVPLFFPIYMDTVLADTYWQSIKNQYKQQRRWAWGCETIPWVFYHSLKARGMPWRKRLYFAWFLFEGFYSWAIASLVIFLFGWLPVLLGGDDFNQTVLAFNLPKITSWIMSIAMLGMLISAFITVLYFPKRPKRYKRSRWLFIILQWILVPIGTIFFGAIPAMEAQIRLMLGKYMGFFVTPKARKSK